MNRLVRSIPKAVAILIGTCFFSGVVTADLNQNPDMRQVEQGEIKNLDTAGLQNLLKENQKVVLVDVRNADEIARMGGTIDAGYRSLNIPRGWLEFRAPEQIVDANAPVVVFCGLNQRSPLAAKTLQKVGYKDVYNYADGFFEWQKTGLPVKLADEATGTMLFRKPQKVADGVWSAIGATAPPTFENSGHNNNLSFVITNDGVLVVNAGDNYLLAQALHDEIRKLTTQPVKYVILENGQGHAMLGMSYWQEQGAQVIAHTDTAKEIKAHGHQALDNVLLRSRDKTMGTKLSKPDRTFEDKLVIELGGERFELLYLGPAHSPGDIVVWLPQRKLAISGDIAFHQRMLPIFDHTDVRGWITTWPKFAALGAQTIIPGHGVPTDLTTVTRYTVDYLQYLVTEVQKILDDDGTLQDAYLIDQSAYAHLDTFDELAKRNAGQVFRAMEFD